MRGVAFLSVVLFACAGAPSRPAAHDDLAELKAQLTAQSAVIAEQQRRIEELEIRMAALQSRAQAATQKRAVPEAQPASPSRIESRPSLRTVKLGGRRPNPVERAPRIQTNVELKEPDEDALARLDAAVADPSVQREAMADLEWANAVHTLNDGEHARAEGEFLAFAAAHPDHNAADNALYLAGLVREVRGDCAGAIPLFESVERRYPAGDAVPMAELELGRCLRRAGKSAEAKQTLSKLMKEHADAPEALRAESLLQGL